MAVILTPLRRSHGLLALEGAVPAHPVPEGPRIGLLNLMPERVVAEVQFGRSLAGSAGSTGEAGAVELVLLSMEGAPGQRRDPEGDAGYRPWQEAIDEGLDGLVVTGAPVERLPFEQVRYWSTMTQLMDATAAAAVPTMYVCWSAQAALYHFHGIDKRPVDPKLFGVYRQRVRNPSHPLLRGLGTGFAVPVSRHASHATSDLLAAPGLELLADHPATGPGLVDDPTRGALYVFNHPEYDTAALDREYHRDLARGLGPAPPVNYYAGKPGAGITNAWADASGVLFRRWLQRVGETRAAHHAASPRTRRGGSILQPDKPSGIRPWSLETAC